MRSATTYLAWNRTVADALFPTREYPAPVFLVGSDLRQQGLPALRALARPCWFRPAFAWFERQTLAWREGDRRNPPPALGLLTVVADVAAQAVQSADSFDQLSQILGIKAARFEGAFRRVEEELWNSLPLWLEAHQWARGADGAGGRPAAGHVRQPRGPCIGQTPVSKKPARGWR